MQANETLKSNPAPQMEFAKTPEGEKKGWVDRLKTSVGDTISDVMTANKMAADKFEGDTALMQIAKGGMTTLIGAGLEHALEGTWQDALDGKPLLQRPWVQFSPKTIEQINALKLGRPELYTFITQASKDLVTGVVYNGLAFFSRPMLKSASGGHLLTSLGINAAEAWGTKGLKSEVRRNSMTEEQKRMRSLGVAIKDADEALNIYRHLFPRPEIIQARKTAAFARSHAIGEYNALNKSLPILETIGWQTELRKYLKYSNPATLLGLDMIVTGGITLWENIKKVKEVRKEKGGLEGKKVFMPREDKRREYSGKPQYNKDKVYYGKGRSNWDDRKQQEEEDRAKLM